MSVEMTIQDQSGKGNMTAGFVFQIRQELTAPGNSEWVHFPLGAKGISIILSSTGDGRIEATNASYANISADTVSADEIAPWPLGNIGIAKKDNFLLGANAFRMVNISGTTIMSAVANN